MLGSDDFMEVPPYRSLLLCCLCCLPSRQGPGVHLDQPAATKKLLTELRGRHIRAKYWNYIREFPTPPFPPFVHGIAIWLSGDDGTTVYEVLRDWLDDNMGARVEVTVGSLQQVEIGDITREQFLTLLSSSAL